MALTDPVFKRELERLREVERFITQFSDTYNSNTNSRIAISLQQLKECIYFFRSAEGRFTSDYKFQSLYGEFDGLVTRFSQLVTNRKIDHFESIFGEINIFHKQLLNFDQNEKTPTLVERIDQQNTEIQSLRSLLESKVQQIETSQKSANENIEKAQEISKDASDAVTRVVTDKVSKEWTKEYDAYINPDETSNGILKKRRQDIRETKSIPWKGHIVLKTIRWSWYVIEYLWRKILTDLLFYNGKSYVNQMRRWRLVRFIWQSCLMAMAILYFLSLQDYNYATDGWQAIVSEKTIFLPLVAVVTLALVFSSKNFKISAHLLEQYRHRYVVTQMMGHLVELKELDAKSQLLQDGAKILFEFKSTGYMNKSSDEFATTKHLADVLSSKVSPQSP